MAASAGECSFALGLDGKLQLDFRRRLEVRVRINKLDPLHFVDRIDLAHILARAVALVRPERSGIDD